MHIMYSLFPLAATRPSDGFLNTITLWTFILVGLMAIGGYFMFRKFLKVLPMRDGKSKLDWQNYWVERSRPLWTEESKALLNLFVEPVPNAFRDIAKHTIAAKIGQLAVESGAAQVTHNHCVEGYIKATPKRDYKYLVKNLRQHNIDYSAYEHLLQQ
ncbi:DUF2621 domain-containing protein [Paenibacillus sp. SC116]|uniref:DUF2621 domain-containing protein n=1 Tax=Paenibacillus sp. SC116 TaxID=2968986 RepID=UPI00215A7F82|nr:DUF2621 domain-containing protein [Paenibacillus sp. SC116]MCR8844003.1 DUF2621 domain-containing protein [Paenibacillus sp. SC116]